MAAAAHTIPQVNPAQPGQQPGAAPVAAEEHALVPADTAVDSGIPQRPAIPAGSVLCRLPVEVELGLPVRDFRVRNLLALQPGVIVASRWSYSEDLPLSAGDVRLAWTQFEVVDTNLATRITRLA